MKRLAHIVLVLTLVLCWCGSTWAQAKLLPDVTSTEGREFFVAWLPNGGSDPRSADLKLQLIVNTRKANNIRVEFPNGSAQDFAIGAGKTELITIDPQMVYWDPTLDEEEKTLNKGLRVFSISDERFTLYSTSQIGTTGTYSFDGAHILPVEALGTEYMVQMTDVDKTATEFVIMSTKPGITNVTLSLTVNSRRGNKQQLTFSFSGPKQIYIVRSKAPDPQDPSDLIDLTGSTICSDQPVAVWSGNQQAVVPNQEGMNDDHAYDQLLPITRWGKEFVVPATACNTSQNVMRFVALQDGTNVTMIRGTTTNTVTLGQGEVYSQQLTVTDKNNPYNATRYITADKPIQVHLFSTSAGANTWYDDDDVMHTPSDPSMTLIPPLEFLTDTTIFHTYNGGAGNLVHMLNIWALTSKTGTIKLDGASLSGWRTVAGNTNYSQLNVEITDTTHIITAPTKCFSGYAYGINDGQAYLYPVGYDFTPKKDSLFLLDDGPQYIVRPSEWKADYVSPTEGGWLLDRILLDNGKYLLDSTFVCDSTTLTFPIKTYNVWEKVRWEIEGSIQGMNYFTPVEQFASTTPRPELEHQFHLLPKERNSQPFEDFEVRGILFRKPIICDIPEDKWEKDTFNTVVRVLRQYNDTTWRTICWGDTVQFFRDTVWQGSSYTMQTTVFNDTTNNPTKGLYQYALGAQTITRHYISSGGCDSLSTLELFVCMPHYDKVDTVVCEDNLRNLDFGDFFLRYKTHNTWPKADTTLFDTLRATDCMHSPDFEPFRKHCPRFNGCDSVLELHLKVMRVYPNTLRVNQCMSTGPIYEWIEPVSGRLIRTFDANTMTKDSIYIFRETRKYTNCEGCTEGGCDSVRNTLYLQFVSDAGQTHTAHVCQGKTYDYVNMDWHYTFDSNGKLCNTPYEVVGTVHVYGQGQVLCSFEDRVTFYIDTVYKDQMTYDTICWEPTTQGQTYSWENHPKFANIPVTGPGLFTYVDTMKTAAPCNCDSICVLKLRVGRPYMDAKSYSLCDNDTLRWQDTLFVGYKFAGTLPANVHTHTISTSIDTHRDTFSMYGCDSLFTLHITLNPTYVAERKDTFVCANEPYDFYGTLYNTPDNPWVPGSTNELTIQDYSVCGCDSMVMHFVTVYPAYLDEREVNDTVCQVLGGGAYYEWPGADHQAWNERHIQPLSRAGVFELVDPLVTTKGCDSIIHRTLVILPTYDLQFSKQMSSEDTLHWEGRIYAGENAEFDNPQGLPVIECRGTMEVHEDLHTAPVGTHSCDSLRTLTIKIGKIFRDTIYDATCANCGTYRWIITSPITGLDTVIYIHDVPQADEEKIYYDSLETAMGYDSIYVLRLTGYPNYDFDAADRVCQGETYIWTDHMPMVYSTTEHHLYVNGREVSEIPTGQYGIIQVVDSMVTDRTYTNPKTGQIKPMRCDSVWTLTLTIDPTYNSRYVDLTDHVSMSSNDTLSHFVHPNTLFVGYHFDYEAAGVTKEELEQMFDSVIYLSQHVGTTYYDSVVNQSINGCDSVHYIQIHICEVQFTQLVDSIGDNDSTWYFGGNTGTTGRGEHTLPLVTGEKFHYYDDGTPVDYSVAEGRTMREYLFIDTLYGANGCDSIVHDLVRVFPTYRFEFDTAVCSNTPYSWRGKINLNRGRTGFVYDSVGYKIGTQRFDSVYVLYLDVMPSGYWSFDTTICMNDTLHWYYQTVYYQGSGLKYIEAVYKDENSPCGDIYHLDLHFEPYYGEKMVEYDTICQSEAYHWISPGEIKEHTQELRDEAGHPISAIPTDVAGEFVFYDSLRTKSCGCDSTYTLHLVIKPSYHFFDTLQVFCSSDTVDWHGQQYYYQGEADVYDTLFDVSTVHACDSNYYLRIHFNLAYDITDSLFLCSDEGHYTWEDIVFDDTLTAAKTWSEPRDYYFTRAFQTVGGGCDSIRHLKLTIAPSYDSIWTDTFCIGETYQLFDQRLTEPGEYLSIQQNRFGCNSYYYLTLVARPVPLFNLQAEPVCVDEQGAANVYLLHYSFTGPDAPISYSITYDSVAQSLGFQNEQDVPLAPNDQMIALPVPSYDEPTQYPRPGYYNAVIAFNNGVCLSDSLMTYPFVMEMRYPSWLLEQRHNDVIALLDYGYNGGYRWTTYQWYEGEERMEGQTKPYLHLPTGLTAGSSYSVELTRTTDSVTVRTCPIVAKFIPDDFAPKMGYLAVTPTCVVSAHPWVTILSRKDGTYRVTTSEGRFVNEGTFRANETPIQIPAVEGLYVIQLWSDDTPEEPYRAIKVLVSQSCPNCDISSF